MDTESLPTSVTALAPGTSQALATTIGDALAAQVQASVQARCLLALKRPRDNDVFRVALLKECRRVGFAKAARYSKPMGKGKPIEGPSIRFVEAALRCYRNVYASTTVIFDDQQRRIVRVQVMDLENCLTYEHDIALDKTVERANGTGRTVIGQRTNSQGNAVFLVMATEDEILVKQAALVSKAIRTCGLRLLPGDIVDEAQAAVMATRQNGAADPDAFRKQVCDDYASIGVTPEHLKEYLGHDLAACTATERSNLWDLFCALRDGETTWTEIMESVKPAAAPPESEPERKRGAALGLPNKKEE